MNKLLKLCSISLIVASCSSSIRVIDKKAPLSIEKKSVSDSAENQNQKSENNAIKEQSLKTELKNKLPMAQATLPKKIATKTFENSDAVKKYCDKTDWYFKKYKWGNSSCHNYSWHHVRNSYWGNPIVWYVFGDENIPHKNTTLFMCGVHGDEITPVKFCYDVLEDLAKNPEVVGDNLIIIAPLVTPDSFFRKYPTRTNARGVDVNRNFPTKDWDKNALRLWKKRYRSDKRRYPGEKPLSEQETIFQVNLIKRYKPNKIITVHSPLTLIDYDGPDHEHANGNLAKQLLIQMSDKAGSYKINDYPFFTGSLGNWAGNERNIPTYTLELPNSDWTKTKRFFNKFRLAIHHAINHDFTQHSKSKDDSKKVSTTQVKEGRESDQSHEEVL